jgi:hypothetical protein
MTDTITATFNRQKPGLTITGIYQLSNVEYVVEAVEEVNAENYNDPFYKVDTRTWKITNYLPIAELERFMNAVENHTVYKRP